MSSQKAETMCRRAPRERLETGTALGEPSEPCAAPELPRCLRTARALLPPTAGTARPRAWHAARGGLRHRGSRRAAGVGRGKSGAASIGPPGNGLCCRLREGLAGLSAEPAERERRDGCPPRHEPGTELGWSGARFRLVLLGDGFFRTP